MDPISIIVAGATLATVIAIEYGGVFMLSILRKKRRFTATQTALFRAGHAHAGVLIILGLLVLVLLNLAGVGWPGTIAAIGVLVGGPILMPAGFFLSPLGSHADSPGPLIRLTYVGAVVMGASLLVAAVLLIVAGTKGL